jgi:2-(1,2-epoxy-1,2-dihydrophenyl)acetyl-CoA isomerase
VKDIIISRDGHVVTAELNRPPANFFDETLLSGLADILEELSDDPQCRAVVLCSAGKHFCAGADFSGRAAGEGVGDSPGRVYEQAVRLFTSDVPMVAAVQGAAVGGGLGLACAADFRVASPQTRFVANFSKLGFHHGFGLTVTLPEIVGRQPALEMLYTSVRVDGERARAIGLADRLVPADQLRSAARELAQRIADAAPLAVRSIRRTMRAGLADRVAAATEHERVEQQRLSHTEDWAEGIQASLQRRPPVFHAR